MLIQDQVSVFQWLVYIKYGHTRHQLLPHPTAQGHQEIPSGDV
jgi:hypothetical protein